MSPPPCEFAGWASRLPGSARPNARSQADESFLIASNPESSPASFGLDGVGMSIVVVLATGVLALGVGVRLAPRSRLGVIVLLLSLVALGTIGGPWALAAGMFLTALGWRLRPAVAPTC